MTKGAHRIVWRRLDRHTSTTRVKTIESQHLQIRNFTADEDNGIYTCALYSLPDNTLIDETQIELNLPSGTSHQSDGSSSTRRRISDVRVLVHNRYSVDYGSTVKMTCATQQDEFSNDTKSTNLLIDRTAYSLEWIRHNDKMPNNSHVSDNSLTLFNVSKENLGEYVCLVTNKAG